jgi:GNAT superfamily N-acetyltransferase
MWSREFLVPSPEPTRPRGDAPAVAPYPSHLVEAWQLSDGTPVTIRPIRASDMAIERTFLAGLSSQTRYQRLLSARKLLRGELRRLTHIDYARDMALVAVAWFDGVETLLGVARYVRLADGQSAEFAIVVGDAWQRRRMGEKLMRSLLEAAVRHGVQSLVGLTLTGNVRMQLLARKLGFTLALDRGDATVTHLRRLIGAVPERAGAKLNA